MKDIIIPNGQPWLSPTIKVGAPVTADQFAMDFTVAVDSDGCYIVDFQLNAEMHEVVATGGGAIGTTTTRTTVLEDTSAAITPLCLSKGNTDFRLTPGASAPPGATLPPAPPPDAR